ncbi:MAG: MFS transporter, partial [Clostridiaceae bacterium]|nr:MFS transporter [Clostridiaceae bacterium]
RYRYVILLLVCLCGLSTCYSQFQLSPLANEIMRRYGLTSIQFSSVFSAPMVPAVFLSIAAGIIMDMTGPKKMVTFGLLIGAIGLTIRCGAKTYALFYIAMLCPGFAATFVNATNAKIFEYWFPIKQVSVAVGVFLAASSFGMVLGTGTTAMLPSVQVAFIIAAVLTYLVLVLWMLFMREPVHGTKTEVPERPKLRECLAVVLKNKDVIVASICILCTFGAYMVLSTFLPSALASRGISSVQSGMMASMVSVGYLAGCIAVPIIINKTGGFRVPVMLLALAGALLAAFSWQAGNNVLATAGLMAAGFSLGGLLPLFMSLPIKLNAIGGKYAGTAGGLISTMQLLGAVIVPTYIVAPVAGDSFELMFILAGVCAGLVCVFSFFFSRETEH